ncbi:uncharacterized protein LOC142329161 [Lycorma delicatula]|uniref:uncharacterized protein LOC142329161 n=1 Tax=Lycorma delicatula TaxID=130591 RepID=UPI003F5105E2
MVETHAYKQPKYITLLFGPSCKKYKSIETFFLERRRRRQRSIHTTSQQRTIKDEFDGHVFKKFEHKDGLCDGTRFTVRRMENNVLKCKILTGVLMSISSGMPNHSASIQ